MEINEDWVTSSTDDYLKNYSVDKYYMRSSDGHGHSAKIQVKLLSAEAAQVAKWTGHDATPYRSMQDLMRDAIVHRIHQLEEMHAAGQMDAEMRQHQLMSRIDTERQRRVERQELLAEFPGTIRSALGDGEVAGAAEMCDHFDETVADWPTEMRRRGEMLSAISRAEIRQAVKSAGGRGGDG